MKDSIAIFWFRRDLRLEDNTALNAALLHTMTKCCQFSFLTPTFWRSWKKRTLGFRSFIAPWKPWTMSSSKDGSGVSCFKGKAETVFKHLIEKYNVTDVYFNKDYEPYALSRDKSIQTMLNAKEHLPHILSRTRLSLKS